MSYTFVFSVSKRELKKIQQFGKIINYERKRIAIVKSDTKKSVDAAASRCRHFDAA